jgi:hypothetical protein
MRACTLRHAALIATCLSVLVLVHAMDLGEDFDDDDPDKVAGMSWRGAGDDHDDSWVTRDLMMDCDVDDDRLGTDHLRDDQRCFNAAASESSSSDSDDLKAAASFSSESDDLDSESDDVMTRHVRSFVHRSMIVNLM